MSCNDILDELKKKGIISDEGVIDSYLFCKHVEELFGKSYLKEHNIVLDDDEKEENKDDFNITVLKQYFINSNRSVEDSKIATNALYNILDRNKFEYYYLEYRTKTDSIHERDIFCWFDLGTDRKKFEKLLKNYGFTFIFDDEEDGFWITGVKE